MKTIGLLGGMSWESTAHYYAAINQITKERLGGLHSAKLLLWSVDFAEIEQLQRSDRWDQAGDMLGSCAHQLESAGADCIVLCTNTMHKVADAIARSVTIPLLHIADATARRIQASEISKVGLLGTRFTMEQDFYSGRLSTNFGLQVLIPQAPAREIVHHVIYEELCQGIIRDESREEFRRIVRDLIAEGAQGIILGCTEIGMLISQQDSGVAVFDTTQIHAEAAVEFALSSE